MKTNVVLLEPVLTGHHAGYLAAFIDGFIELGCRVDVLCPNIQGYEEHFDKFESDVCFYEFEFSLGTKGSKWELRKEVRDYLKILSVKIGDIEKEHGIHVDLLYFCMIDSLMGKTLFSWDIEQCLPYSFSGLYFHPVHFRLPIKFERFRVGPFKIDAPLDARNCKGFMLLDDAVAEQYIAKGANAFSMPDFSINDELTKNCTISEEIKNLANGRKIICLIGSQQKRKGLLSLLRAAQELSKNDFYFVIVGQLVRETYTKEEVVEIEKLLQMNNVYKKLEYVRSEQEINEYIQCSDLIFAAYENFCHSSNMLIKASVFQVPLIVSSGYYMEEQVEQHSLGVSVPESDVAAIVSVLNGVEIWKLKDSEQFRKGCACYAESNSKDKVKEVLQQMLEVN
jgi:glycosyltransferase involved in cell wall biosynthesis